MRILSELGKQHQRMPIQDVQLNNRFGKCDVHKNGFRADKHLSSAVRVTARADKRLADDPEVAKPTFLFDDNFLSSLVLAAQKKSAAKRKREAKEAKRHKAA